MPGRSIYLKLYVSFILIFVATMVLVIFLSARFYGDHLRNEISEYSLSEARFLRDEFAENCGAMPSDSSQCGSFLQKIKKMGLLRFWVMDPRGAVLFSNQDSTPRFEPLDLTRAAAGEEVVRFARRGPPRILLPVSGSGGVSGSILMLQRPLHRDRFPRFPMGVSLVIAGIAIAIMILPLSRKITRPLRELHGLARKWSDGHLEERAEIRGADEISELGTVFNSMANNLQRMLQQKKEFLALISHELKSPVARMRIATELMAEKHGGDPKTVALIRGMQKDLEESEKMIEQLLIISRIEMDLPSSIHERVDAGEVLAQSIQQVEPMANANGVSLQSRIVQPPPAVRGDPAELQRAVANILENAVKFSPGGSRVDASCSRNNGSVEISISDSGIGIDPDDISKIFEPFYRGKTARSKEGSGLGLFLARKIVEKHGGAVTASRNTPAGTVITVILPETGQS